MAGEAIVQLVNAPMGVVETGNGAIAALRSEQASVVTVGLQGPSGRDGEGVLTALAAQPISGERVVRLDATRRLRYAANAVDQIDVVCGLSRNAAQINDPVVVQSVGEFENLGWNWTPGAPLFLGLNGFLTEVPPQAGVLLQVATAITSTKIFINIESPIFL